LKDPFVGFTRSGITIERKNSGQFPRSAGDKGVTVISITPPSQPNPEPARIRQVSGEKFLAMHMPKPKSICLFASSLAIVLL